MRIGITGHQRLDDESEWPRVRTEIRQFLEGMDGLKIGVSSLAIGADQVFAEVVLSLGGSIEAVIPFEGYESKFNTEASRANYLGLLAKASDVIVLPAKETEEEAYFDAGKLVVDTTDKLLAVWDGKHAEGLGGTGDVVAYANQNGKPVILISVTG